MTLAAHRAPGAIKKGHKFSDFGVKCSNAKLCHKNAPGNLCHEAEAFLLRVKIEMKEKWRKMKKTLITFFSCFGIQSIRSTAIIHDEIVSSQTPHWLVFTSCQAAQLYLSSRITHYRVCTLSVSLSKREEVSLFKISVILVGQLLAGVR